MTQTGERIILYTTPNCSACDRARADLTAEGVDFEERSVMAKQEWFDEVLKYSISVPVIIRGDKVEVGWKGDIGCAIY
jgi:glutaredoxin